MRQIPLPLKLESRLVFANFYAKNNDLITSLCATKPQLLLITGLVGKTHLLQALCNNAQQQNKTFFYLPLRKIFDLPATTLAIEANYELLCIDDIDLIAGNMELEKSLFNLYNSTFDRKQTLILSAVTTNINFILPDLASRIKQLAVLKIPNLTDEDLSLALQLQAKSRGINLDEKVLAFVQTHLPRRLKTLMNLLDKLEILSLAKQQKITVPLVKLAFTEL